MALPGMVNQKAATRPRPGLPGTPAGRRAGEAAAWLLKWALGMVPALHGSSGLRSAPQPPSQWAPCWR